MQDHLFDLFTCIMALCGAVILLCVMAIAIFFLTGIVTSEPPLRTLVLTALGAILVFVAACIACFGLLS